MIRNPKTLEQGIKNLEQILRLYRYTDNKQKQKIIIDNYLFVHNMLKRKLNRLKQKDRTLTSFYNELYHCIQKPDIIDMDSIENILEHYTHNKHLKGRDFEMEYNISKEKKKLEEGILFVKTDAENNKQNKLNKSNKNKNRMITIPIKRTEKRILLYNRIKDKIESWYYPKSISLEYKKHTSKSNNKNASVFLNNSLIEKIDLFLFANGRGILKEENTIFLYLVFDEDIGYIQKNGKRKKTPIVKSYLNKVKNNKISRVTIHSYPISYYELKRDLRGCKINNQFLYDYLYLNKCNLN